MAEKRVLCISAEGFEDSELLCPVNRMLEEGYTVDIAAPAQGEFKGKHGYSVEANRSVDELSNDPGLEYDLLLLPGGKAPAKLRTMEKVLQAAKSFDAANKPIASICHGPQILISAGLLSGRKATSYSSVAKELTEAGAEFLDQEVVVDGRYVFSRNPKDLPAFNREMIRMLSD